MKESFTADNYRDWGGRYNGTFGWLVKGDKKTLVKLADSNDEYVYFNTEEGGIAYHAKIDSGVEFEFLQVDHAYMTGTTGGVYLMYRVPQRQWRRGIHRNNTGIYTLTGGVLFSTDVSFAVLNDIYSSVVTEPISKLVADKTYKLSRAFALSASVLYFYDKKAGVFSEKANTITLNAAFSSIKQELLDAVRRNGLSTLIEVSNAD